VADRLVTSDTRTAHGGGVVRYADRRRGLPCRAPDLLGIRCDQFFGSRARTVAEITAAALDRDAHELDAHELAFVSKVHGYTAGPVHDAHVAGGRARWRRGLVAS
jgi:hypothetical protein